MEDRGRRRRNRDNHININYERHDKNEKEPKERTDEIKIDQKKASKHYKININGIDIYFPYVPYENQRIYMEKVIEALETGSTAALESPTGTGKTLCLLCASLAWLKNKRAKLKNSNPNEQKSQYILYTSRTHSQLSNVIKELKKTCYLPKTAILGSRESLCVNSIVKNSSGNNINLKCQIARMKKECKYHNSSEISAGYSAYDCIDIEELKHFGEASNFCPFYLMRKKKESSDIVFLPYNYIFNTKFLDYLKIDLNNSILLIDEAHNIEEICESSHSAELTVKSIDACLDNLKQFSLLADKMQSDIGEYGQVDNKKSKDLLYEFLQKLDRKLLSENEMILLSLKSNLKGLTIQQVDSRFSFKGKSFSPELFFNFIFDQSSKEEDKQAKISNLIPNNVIPKAEKRGLNQTNIDTHITFLKQIERMYVDVLNKNCSLIDYLDFLSLIKELSLNYYSLKAKESPTYKVEHDYECLINNYRIYVLDEEETSNDSNDKNFNQRYNNHTKNNNRDSFLNKNRKISLFCLNPGLGFKNILNAGIISTILTSGTLSPITSMESELKCEFKVKLENKHVIDNKQVHFCMLKNSLDDKKTLFDFRANNRGNDVNEKLGYTITDLVKVTPQGTGVLCFFTSYFYMNQCFESWSKKSILSEMEKSKEIFKDFQNSSNNKNLNVIKNFNDACSSNVGFSKKKGGILFSVFRGSSSEGIDFSDDKARMVIIVGIPYANLGDIKVNLKKEFLDEYAKKAIKGKGLKLQGSDWYKQNALKAVNQALGRVIRHTNDFGSMILIDYRYYELSNQNVFSKWLRENFKIYDNKKILENIKNFFDNMPGFIKQRLVEQKNIKKISKNKVLEETDNLNLSTTNNNFQNQKIIKEHALPRSELGLDEKPEIIIKKSSKRREEKGIDDSYKNSHNKSTMQDLLNDVFKTNNKSANDLQNNTFDKSNKMPSFMKSDHELEESLQKNYMNKLYKDSKINFNDSIKKKIEFDNRTVVRPQNITSTRDEANLEDKIKSLDAVKLNLQTTEFESDMNNFIEKENINYRTRVAHKMTTINETKYFTHNKDPNLTNECTMKRSPINDSVLSEGLLMKIFEGEKKSSEKEDIFELNTRNFNRKIETPLKKESIDLTNEDLEFINNLINEEELISSKNFDYNFKNNSSKNNLKPKCEDIDLENKPLQINKNEKSNQMLFNNLNNEKYCKKNQPPNNNNKRDTTNNITNKNNINNNSKDLIILPREILNEKPENNFILKKSPKKHNELENASNYNNIIDNKKNDLENPELEAIVENLQKMKQSSDLTALFKKYNIIISPKKEETKVIEKKGIECPICYESHGKKFQTAKCGHLACSDCWQEIFKTKFECPICKKKTNTKKLTNIYI